MFCVWFSGNGTYIVPDGHDQNHRNLQSGVELVKTANLLEPVTVAKSNGSRLAKLRSDRAGVARDAVPLGGGYLDLLVVLHEELGKLVLLELGHDSKLFAGVDRKALAVEVLVAHSVRVVVTAVSVTVAREPVVRVGAAAARRFANVVLVVLARVRCESKCVCVGFPNVDLGTAAAVRTDAGVGVVARCLPAVDVGLATDELEIAGALGVAVLFLVTRGAVEGEQGALTPVPYLAPALLLGYLAIPPSSSIATK